MECLHSITFHEKCGHIVQEVPKHSTAPACRTGNADYFVPPGPDFIVPEPQSPKPLISCDHPIFSCLYAEETCFECAPYGAIGPPIGYRLEVNELENRRHLWDKTQVEQTPVARVERMGQRRDAWNAAFQAFRTAHARTVIFHNQNRDVFPSEMLQVIDQRVLQVEDNDMYAICQNNVAEPYTPDDDTAPSTEVRQTPCNHIFHLQCIAPWIDDHNDCPLCRTEFHVIRTPLSPPFSDGILRQSLMAPRFAIQTFGYVPFTDPRRPPYGLEYLVDLKRAENIFGQLRCTLLAPPNDIDQAELDLGGWLRNTDQLDRIEICLLPLLLQAAQNGWI